MTLIIDLSPEMETQVHEEAAKEGIAAPEYIVATLKERLRHSQAQTLTEDELLRRISSGLPEEVWERYHALIAKRRAETLTPSEHAALIALSDRIEEANTQRIGYVAELARIRQMPLDDMMRTLGIGPRPDA